VRVRITVVFALSLLISMYNQCRCVACFASNVSTLSFTAYDVAVNALHKLCDRVAMLARLFAPLLSATATAAHTTAASHASHQVAQCSVVLLLALLLLLLLLLVVLLLS
jgi:hypothetical protein